MKNSVFVVVFGAATFLAAAVGAEVQAQPGNAARVRAFAQTQALLDEINLIEGDIVADRLERALARANELVRLNPDSGAAFEVRGNVHFAAKRQKDAITDFTKSLSFLDDDFRINDGFRARLFHARGDALYYVGSHDAAIADYAKVIQFGAKSKLPAHIREHVSQKQIAAAFADYRIAFSNIDNRNSYNLYISRGQLHSQVGNWDEAIADYNAAIKIDPSGIVNYYQLGTLYGKKNNLAGAVAAYTQGIKNYKEADKRSLYTWYNRRASAHARMGNIDLAIADYVSSISVYPSQLEAYVSRGKLYRDKGRNADAAIADFSFVIDRHNRLNSSLSKSKEMAEPYHERGISLAALGRSEPAIADLSKAVELDPAFMAAFFARSTVHCGAKRPDLAKLDENKVIALGFKIEKPCTVAAAKPVTIVENMPTDLKTAKEWFDYGMNHWKTYRIDEIAIAAYTKAIALKADYAEAYVQRALVHASDHGMNDAHADISRAIEIVPKNPSYYLIRASFFCGSNDMARAKLAEKAAISFGGKVTKPCK